MIEMVEMVEMIEWSARRGLFPVLCVLIATALWHTLCCLFTAYDTAQRHNPVTPQVEPENNA